MSNDTDIVEALRQLRSEMALRFTGDFAENALNTLDAATEALASRQTDEPEAGLVEELKARIDGLTQERDFHRETADLHAERLTALSRNHRDAVPIEMEWSRGQRVTKIKGSNWTGKIVGFYSTELTPEGYAVESETEKGSVQIYPRAALALKEPKP